MSLFHTRGPVPLVSPAYVPRQFESDLRSALFAGDWILLLGARQTGKTTSLLRIHNELKQMGAVSALVDLQQAPPTDSYGQLVDWFSRSVGQQWRPDRPASSVSDPEVALHLAALAPNGLSPVFVFIDEAAGISDIDKRNVFFGQIRAMATQRAYLPREHVSSRVRFVFSGMFHPERLVQTANSPFNVCEEILTDDLTRDSTFALWHKVRNVDDHPTCSAVWEEVAGQPYLTQALFTAVSRSSTGFPIDAAVERLKTTGDAHFSAIVRDIRASEALVAIVRQLVRSGQVAVEPADPSFRYLQVVGIAKQVGETLRWRNPMYQALMSQVTEFRAPQPSQSEYPL